MEIAVIGATGKTGRPFVGLALAAGHTVRAFSASGRPLDGLDVKNTALDATDGAAVTAAIAGVDAVVSTVGGALENRPKTIANLLTAMKAHGIDRIIGIGGAGALDGPGGDLMVKQPWFPEQLKPVTEMHVASIEALRGSDARWTFICPPVMLDGEVSKAYQHQAESALFGLLKVRHADVAHLILRCLDEDLYIGNRVAIGEP